MKFVLCEAEIRIEFKTRRYFLQFSVSGEFFEFVYKGCKKYIRFFIDRLYDSVFCRFVVRFFCIFALYCQCV